MEPQTVEDFCTLLSRSKLVTADEVKTLYQKWCTKGVAVVGELDSFIAWLVEVQYLTGYQAGLLRKGHADHFFLNDYKLLDRIGQGGMAGVYKAVHRLGQTVAIKVLPPSKTKTSSTFARFQREGRLAVKLKHPNVVRTYEIQEAAGLFFIVMEYVSGETLEQVLKRRKKLPPDEAVRLIYQAFQGLKEIHEQDVVHRDLKPANLMLTPAAAPGQPDNTLQATVKVLDVGLGKSLFDEGDDMGAAGELTAAGDVLGTPNYMAPEQARDARTADVRADIYALGCVLYHCLTGQPPFPDGNIVRKLYRHATETPKTLKAHGVNAPEGLQLVLDTLMAKDAAQRYSTPERAGKALEAFLPAGAAAPGGPDSDPRMKAYQAWLDAQTKKEGAAAPAPPPTPPVAKGGARGKQPVAVAQPVKPPLATPASKPPPVPAGPPTGPAKVPIIAAARPAGGLKRRDLIWLALGGLGVALAVAGGIYLVNLSNRKTGADDKK